MRIKDNTVKKQKNIDISESEINPTSKLFKKLPSNFQRHKQWTQLYLSSSLKIPAEFLPVRWAPQFCCQGYAPAHHGLQHPQLCRTVLDQFQAWCLWLSLSPGSLIQQTVQDSAHLEQCGQRKEITSRPTGGQQNLLSFKAFRKWRRYF